MEDPRKAVAGALEARAGALTEEWHGQLEDRLGLRPGVVFPTESLLDHIPGVVRWIAGRVTNGASSRDLTQSLRALVRLRREQGHFMEELMVEFRMLGQLLADAAAEEIAALDPPVGATEASRMTADLMLAVNEALTVLGAVYHEEEVAAEERAAERLDEYAQILSHELTNPLSSADVAAQALELAMESDQAARGSKMVGRVRSSVGRALSVLKAVRGLALSGEDTGPQQPPESAAAVIRRAVRHVSAKAERASVRIDVELSSTGGAAVDGERLQLILHNLLANAIKYADAAKPDRWARVELTEAPGRCQVTVSDNGIGVPEADVGRIFERFYRAHSGHDGHGLGLAIARDAAQRAGGTIECASEAGEGSTFTVLLPLLAPAEDEAIPAE